MEEGHCLPPKPDAEFDFVLKVAGRIAAADPLDEVLDQIVEFVAGLVKCDSCFIYALENNELVLRASLNPHPEIVGRIKLQLGQGLTGWVAENLEPVALSRKAFQDPRFRVFNELPEDRYEAFLSVPVLSRGKLVGVINLQHRAPHVHSQREVRLVSMLGFLVGAEMEMARLESEAALLSEKLESRKAIERAKGILQRELGIAEEDAYITLQKQSRQRRKSMKEVAEALILSEELKRGAAR
jgi:uroporphyrinogen-III synthase